MIRFLLAALCALFLAVPHVRAEPPINTNRSAHALAGYDVVAYFTDHKPVKGSAAHALEYAGASWLFASAEHKALFQKEPARYLPAYRGYCAYGVSKGYLVGIDPRAFTVRDGTLYLNYSLDVRDKWLADPAAYIARANKNWPGL